MMPYYEDEAVTLYHGDCREVLPSIAIAPTVVAVDPPHDGNRRSTGPTRSATPTAPTAPTATAAAAAAANTRTYICTWVENNISGNPSEYTCYPAAVQP